MLDNDPCPSPSKLDEADLLDFTSSGDPWAYQKLGPRKGGAGKHGLLWSLSVWAPAAASVRLAVYPLYDPPLEYPMSRLGDSGVWLVHGLELPALTRYKFLVETPEGTVFHKETYTG